MNHTSVRIELWLALLLALANVFVWGEPNTALQKPEPQTPKRRLESPFFMPTVFHPSYSDTTSFALAQRLWQLGKLGQISNLVQTPIRLEQHHETPVNLAVLRGGKPVSVLSLHRQSVGEFVAQTSAVGGINGGFFVDASLSGTNNDMIGPAQTLTSAFRAEPNPDILRRIRQRPLVVWSERQIAILPFDPQLLNTPKWLGAFVPNFSHVFLGGAWILHHGSIISQSELETNAPQDASDVRPRVFFGLTKQGEVVLGASLNGSSSQSLAKAARAAGVHEAVLLDSGYSTSLIFGSSVIAVGRRTAKVPSRPVPHAIVLLQPSLEKN